MSRSPSSPWLSRAVPSALTWGLLVATATLAVSAEAAPKKSKKPAVDTSSAASTVSKEESPDFDRQAAANAITEIDLHKCRATNATRGEGHVMITFTPTGKAERAEIDKGPWVGTPVAKCMAKAFKKTKVPAFKGDAVTVGKTFKFE
jgi:hypothetical protein